MPRLCVLIIGCVALLLVARPTVAEAALLDANCPGPPNFGSNVSGDLIYAQTFTALGTGTLVRAEVEIGKAGAPGGDWVLRILATDGSGKPTGTVLAATTVPDATIPDGNSRLSGTFTAPASVVAGQLYALAISRPGANQMLVRERSGDPCPGQEYFSNSLANPWLSTGPMDIVFAIFVDPPNGFSIGGVKRKTLFLTVPGPGRIDVRDGGAQTGSAAIVAGTRKGLKPSSATATGAGTVGVGLRLTRRTKRKLKERGKVKVNAAVTFTPTGGTAKMQMAKLKIKSKRK
ncbi:MAG: hypothetical protein ACXWGV_09915 [Solirubrobacterales bacterium]